MVVVYGVKRQFQHYFSYIVHGGQFYCWRELDYPEKTTDRWQVTEKHLSHNVSISPPHVRVANLQQ